MTNEPVNIVRIAATGQGKSLVAARDAVASADAEFVGDPEKDSLAATVMTHAEGNVLYDRIDDPLHALPYDILTPSAHPDLEARREENQQEAERFGAILLRRQDGAGMAATPLREEWVLALVMLWLCQAVVKPLTYLPSGFLPGTDEFRALVDGCFLPELRHKFGQLARLTASRLLPRLLAPDHRRTGSPGHRHRPQRGLLTEGTMSGEFQQLIERLERMEAALAILVGRQTVKEWYSTDEVARIVGKAEFTVREWCRLGRVNAEKRGSGRGKYQAWVVSRAELQRLERDGLLPVRR